MAVGATVERPARPLSVLSWMPKLPSRRGWLLLLVAGYVLLIAWRLYLSLPLTGPVIHDDEDGYLFAARVLAGGPDATLPTWSIMRPMGYPLLLAPIYLFVQVPVHVYMGVHIVNAIISAANFPLLYVLGRRLFDTTRGWAAAVAFAITTLPSLVFFSEFALTDVVLPVLLLLLLLAVHEMVAGSRKILGGLGAGVVAGYAANTHVRGLVMLVLLIVLIGVGAWRRWFTRWSAVAAGVGAVISYGVGFAINKWLESQLFPGTGAFQPDDRIVGRITSFSGAIRVIGDGLGQIWYMCAATYGLAAIGIATAIILLVRKHAPIGTRVVLGLALATNLGISLATATGIPDEGRINNHFYGRYVAMFAGLWSMVAIITLARATGRRAVATIGVAVMIVLGTVGVTWLYSRNLWSHEVFNSFDAAELSFLSHDYHHLHVLWMTGLALVGTIGFTVLLSGRLAVQVWGQTVLSGQRRTAVAVLCLLTLVNLVATRSITNWVSLSTQHAQYRPGAAQLIRDAHVRPGSSIEEADNVPWKINQRHQREVYWAALHEFNSTGGPSGDPTYVVSLNTWNGYAYGYVVDRAFADPDKTKWIVWRRG
jgi:hypothetical protein